MPLTERRRRDGTGGVRPIADICFDDRDWQSLGRRWDWRRVMKRVRKLYPESTEFRAFMGED
jgi:hypothetical protein